MSAIFISHSTKDNADDAAMGAWLEEQGHKSYFRNKCDSPDCFGTRPSWPNLGLLTPMLGHDDALSVGPAPQACRRGGISTHRPSRTNVGFCPQDVPRKLRDAARTFTPSGHEPAAEQGSCR